jgi:hypothetical protein
MSLLMPNLFQAGMYKTNQIISEPEINGRISVALIGNKTNFTRET